MEYTAAPVPALSSTVHDGRRNRRLGLRGEDIAADYLTELGYRLLDRNWRCGRLGELDLVLLDGDVLVAAEVKTRGGLGYGHPLEAITAVKVRRLHRLLVSWMRERRPRSRRLRIDAVGIVLPPSGDTTIVHLKGVS